MVHDLWTLLQELISYAFMIKKVNFDMVPIINSSGVRGV